MAEDYDDNISELPEFSTKSDFSKARLAEKFIERVCEFRSKEMKEGYFNTKFDKNNNAFKVWVEDSRKVYCSSVEALVALMTPEIYSDERCKKAMIKFEEEKTKIKNKYLYNERIRIIKEDGNGGWKLTGKKYLPKIDERLPIEDPKYPKSGKHFILIECLWNSKVNFYWDEMVQLNDMMFSEINFLIGSSRVNYFKQKSSF